MPPFGPIKRRDFVKHLRRLGFEGPFPGGNHEYFVRDTQRIYIPNPHEADIDRALLGRLLKQIPITKEEWEDL